MTAQISATVRSGKIIPVDALLPNAKAVNVTKKTEIPFIPPFDNPQNMPPSIANNH